MSYASIYVLIAIRLSSVGEEIPAGGWARVYTWRKVSNLTGTYKSISKSIFRLVEYSLRNTNPEKHAK